MTAEAARIAAALGEIDRRVAALTEELESPYLFSTHREDLDRSRAALLAVRELLD